MEKLPSLIVRHDASYRDFVLKSTRVAGQNTLSVRPSVRPSGRPYPRYLCGPPRGPWAWLSGLLAELDALIGLPQASHHLSAMRPSSRDSYFYHRECKNPRCGYHQSYFKHSPKSLHCESLSLIGAKALSGCVCMKSDRQVFASLHINQPSSLAS